MRGYFLFLILVLALVTMGAGCNVNKQTGENINQNQNNFNHRMSSSTPWDNVRVMGTSTDLIVGKKVVVMGTVNSDSTITAQEIMIGDISAMPFGTSTRRQHDFSSSTPGAGEQITPSPSSGGQQWQPPAEGQMPDRAQFRQQTGDGENRIRPARIAGQSLIIGEILKKDDASLVIKLDDGGSKIVFYSATTKIFILTPLPAEKKD